MFWVYVINLRCDAVLYARTINGIRNYFYETKKLDIESENRYRVLIKRTQTPRYFEPTYFFVRSVCVRHSRNCLLVFVGLVFFFAPVHYLFPPQDSGGFFTARSSGLALAVCPIAHIALYGFARSLSRTEVFKVSNSWRGCRWCT